ncbi:hypothetical protein CPB84DRAFT_214145 [Gymnopilus junonius]|uniref:Uncharacterized protein n=1 Tax=Gymnopilus junonius TaxID=109634 RepID=A0A9P5NG20_GYMJU|nr:hypothetical protein CPB84DRAFT_214145 [Gymnopilus junonius]
MAQPDTAALKKPRKIHPGAAAGIFPTPNNNRSKKVTKRYFNRELDLDSIISFITHLRETDDMPTELMRLRGRLRAAFPIFKTNKNLIRAAYVKAGWNFDELSNVTKKQVKFFRMKFAIPNEFLWPAEERGQKTRTKDKRNPYLKKRGLIVKNETEDKLGEVVNGICCM